WPTCAHLGCSPAVPIRWRSEHGYYRRTASSSSGAPARGPPACAGLVPAPAQLGHRRRLTHRADGDLGLPALLLHHRAVLDGRGHHHGHRLPPAGRDPGPAAPRWLAAAVLLPAALLDPGLRH